MANIPVEKSGGSFLPWIIGFLALIGLIWLGLELFDSEPDADEIAGTENNVGIIDDVDLTDEFDVDITDESELYEDFGTGLYEAEVDVAEPDVLGADVDGDGVIEMAGLMDGERVGDARIGRTVNLTGARVLNVVGDSAFFVGTSDDRRVLISLVNLGESELGAGGTDGVFNVDEGESVDVRGTVARYTEGARGTWEVPESDRERLLQQGLFVRVNSPADLSVSE